MGLRPKNPDLKCPEGLSELGVKAWETIIRVARKYKLTWTGGCPAFKAPKPEHINAVLCCVYDGSQIGALLDYDRAIQYAGHYKALEELQGELGKIGLWYECSDGVSGSVYRRKKVLMRAVLETRNFRFEVLTEKGYEEAMRLMERTWENHLRDYPPADPFSTFAKDVQVTMVELESGYRDGERIMA